MAMNTWTKNFGQSVKFGAVDVARDLNPAITKLYDDNKEFMSSIATTLSDIYSGQTKITKALESAAPDLSKTMNAGAGVWEVLKKDAKTFAKTGKVAGAGFEGAGATGDTFKEAGVEMDDGFDLNADEFNFDDLPDPEDLMKGVDAEAAPSTEAVANAGAAEVAAINEGIKADVKIGAANVAAINKTTGAIGTQTRLVAEGFKNVANVNYQLSASMILAQQSIAEKTKEQLKMINDNIANLISFNQDTNLKYTMAAMKYFDDSLEELKKISAGMERMSPTPKEKSNVESDYDKVFGGGFNLQSYWEVIKTNAQNTELGPLLGFLEQPEMLVEALREPMSVLLKWGMTSLIPSVVKRATKELNRTVEEFVPALFAKLSTMGEDYSTNPIFQFIGKLLGVNIGSSSLDLSNYEKGAVPFDGITHKSINQVIPTYLSQIVALLSGGEMRMFDHERGRFYTMSQIRREEKMKDEQDRDYALGEGGRLLDKMKDDFAFETQEQEKAFAKYITDFKDAVVKSRKFIDWNKQEDLDDLFSQIHLEGVDPQTAAMMQQVLPDYFANYIRKNLSHSQQIRMANASNIAAMEKRRRLKNEDARGMAMSRYILSGNSDIELANDVDAFNRRTAQDTINTVGNISSVINLNHTGAGNPPPSPGSPPPQPNITGTSEGKASFSSTGANRRYGPDVRDYREEQEAKDKAAEGEVTYNKDYSKLIDQGMANLDDLIGGVEYATEKIAEFRRKQTAGATADLDDQGLPVTDDDDYEYEGEKEERERRKKEEESFMDKVGRWMNRPTKLLTEAIETIDSTLYRVLFGASPDEESLIHVLVENVKSVFGRLKTFLHDEFYSPIKKFLFGDDFKKSNFYRFFSGAAEKGKSLFNGDFFKEVREQIKEDATDWKDDVTDYIAGSKFKGGRINEAGAYILSAGERVERSGVKGHLAAGTDVIGSTGVYDLKAGDKVIPSKDMKKAAESEATFSFKMFERMHGGLSSKLDQVISAINTNTATMSSDINAVQTAVEEGTTATKDVATKVVATSTGDGKLLPADKEAVGKAKTPKEILAKIESIKKLTGRQKKPFVDVILDKILNATGTFAAMFGGSKNLDNQHIQKEYMKDIRKKAPKVISRGLLGGGFLAAANLSGALTGAHGFGLLGSFFLPGGLFPALMLGMGVSMLHQSDRFTNMMYGRKIDGERQGGIIPKKVIDFFSKHKKHILAGGTIGLLSNLTGLPLTIPKLVLGAVIPGGGMLGGIALSTIGPVLIGSAAAVALHSDKFKRVLFGTGNPEDGKKQFGALNGQFMQRVKKALPNAVVGAGMGYLGMSTLGSIGILGSFMLPAWGGALLGGAIGVGMASEKFKEQMFGKMVNGKFVSGGLVDVMKNAVKAEILKPLSVFAQQSLAKTERFMALEIMMPIRKAMLPYKMLLEATFKKITTGLENFFKGVGNNVNRAFSPILSFLSKVIRTAWDWTWGASKKIINTVFSVAGTAIAMPFKALSASGSFIGLFQNDENQAILKKAKEQNKALEEELKAKYDARLKELDEEEKKYKAERKAGRATGYEATEEQLALKTEQYQQEQEFIKQAQLQADKEAAIRREKAEVQREELKELVKTTNFKLEELSRENKRLLIELTGMTEEQLSAEERISELKVEEEIKAKPEKKASTITTLGATNITPASGITSAAAPKPLQSSQDKPKPISVATTEIKAIEPEKTSSSAPKPSSIKPIASTSTSVTSSIEAKSDKIVAASVQTVTELKSVDRNVSNLVEVLTPVADSIIKEQNVAQETAKRSKAAKQPAVKTKPYVPKQGANATANAIKAADKAASSTSSSSSTTTVQHAPRQQPSITATQVSSIDSTLSESAQYEAQSLIKQDLMIQSLERLYQMLEFKFDDLLATNVEEVKESKKSNKSRLVKEAMSGAARQAGSKALDSIVSTFSGQVKDWAREKFEKHAKGFLTKVGEDVGKAIEDKLTALSATSAGIITSQVNAGLSYIQGQMKTGFEAIYKKITGQDFDWSAVNAGGGPGTGNEDHTSENITELLTVVKTNFPLLVGKTNLIDFHILAQTTKFDQLISATNDVAQAVRDIDFSGPTPPTSTGSPSGAHAAGGTIKKTGTYLLSEGERVIRAGKGTAKDVAKSQDHEANFALKMFERIYGTISEGIASLDEKFDRLIETTEKTGDAIVESTERVVDESQVPTWAKDAFRTSQESIAKLESDAKETTLLRDSSRSVFGNLFGEKEEKEKKPEGLLRDSDKNVGQMFGGRTAQAIMAERKDDKFREDLLGSIRGLKFGQIKAEEKKESWFDKLKGLLGGLFGMLPDILKIGAILAALGAIKMSFTQQTHTDPDATDPYAENVANKERRIVARVAQKGARWAGRQILKRTGHTFTQLAHHGLDTLSGANRAKGLGGPGFGDRVATGADAGKLKEEYLNKAIAHEERYNQLTKEIEQLKLTSTGKIGEADQLKKLEQEAANAKKFSDEMMKYASQMEARELGQGANSSIMDTLKGRNPEAQDAFTKLHDIGNKAINAVKNNATIAKLFGPVGHRNFVGKLVEMLGKITYDFVLKNIGKISIRLAKAGIRVGGLLTGGVANVIFAGIDAFHGASNASTFFHVDPDKVDTAMIAISSIYSVLAGLPVIPGPIPVNPLFVFDLIIDIVYGISGGSVDPKKHLFAMMYECIPFDDKQDIEQLQADSDKNFEEYKKQAGNANKTYLDYQHDKGKENTYIANAIREYVPGGTLLVGKNDEDGTFRHGIMSAVGEEWEQTKGAQVLNPMWMLRAGHRAMFGGKNTKGEKRKGLLSDTFVDRGIENIKAKLGIEDEPEIPELNLPTFNSEEMLNTLQGKMVMLRKMGLKASDYTKEEIAKWDPRSGKLPDLEDMNDLQRSAMDKINAFTLSTESILRNFSMKDFLDTFEGKMLLLSKMGIDAKTYTKEMVEKWDPRNGTLPDMTVMSEAQTKARDALNAVQEKVANATENLANFDLTETVEGKKALIAQLGLDVSAYTEEQIKKWDPLSGYLPDMQNEINQAQFDSMSKLLNLKEKAKAMLAEIADSDPLATVEGKAAMLYQMGIDAEAYTKEQLEQWDPTSGKLPDMTALTGVQADIANKLTEYKRQAQELAQELGDSDPIKTVEGKMAILTSLGFNPAAYSKELIEKWDPTSGKLPDLTEMSQEDKAKLEKAKEMLHRSLDLFDNMEADKVFTTLEGKRNLLYALGVDHTMYSEEEINAWDPHSGTLPDSQKFDDIQTRSFALIDARANQLKEYADYLENEERRDKQNASIFQKFYDKSSEALSGAYRYLFGVSEDEELPEGDELAKDRRGVIGKFLGSAAAFFFGEEDVGDYKGKDGILNRMVQALNDGYDKAFNWVYGNDDSENNYEKASIFRRVLYDAVFFLVGGTHELTGEHKPFTESYLFEPMVKIRKGFNAVSDWFTGGDENSEYGGKNVLRRAIETSVKTIGEGFSAIAKVAEKPLKKIANTAGDFLTYVFGGGLKEDVSKAVSTGIEWITGGDPNGPYKGKFFLRRGLEAGLEKVGEGFAAVSEIFSEPLKKIGTKANEAFQYIFSGQLKEDLKASFNSAVEWITGGAMDSIYKGKNFLERGFDTAYNKASEIAVDVSETFTEFKDYVSTGFESVMEWITGGPNGKNFLARGLQVVTDKASEIADKLSDSFNKLYESVSSTLSSISDSFIQFGKRALETINQQGIIKGSFNILANMLRGIMGLEWDPDPVQKAINAGMEAFKNAFGELGTVGKGILKFFSGLATFVNKAIGIGPVKLVKMLAEWALKGPKTDAKSVADNVGGFWDAVGKEVGGGGVEEINTNPPPEYNAYEYVSSLMGGGADEKSMYFSQKDPRWSSKSLVKGMGNYGNMSKLGCFPSVIAGATNAAYGRPVVKPDTVASMISKNDVAQNGSGTLPSFGPKAASAMGGTFNALDPNDTQSIDNALKRGYKVIGSKPGHYTLYDSHGTHDPLGAAHDESVSAEKISKNAKAPGSPTTVGIITPRGMGLPRDVKSVPLTPGGIQQGSDLQQSLLKRRAEQVLAMRRHMLGGSGNVMRVEQQEGPTCTLHATKVMYRAYKGEEVNPSFGTWASMMDNLPSQEKQFGDRDSFENAVRSHFESKPTNPVYLYQTGGDGRFGNPINAINRWSGNHATVIGRKTSDGKYDIYDSNGGKVHHLELSQIYDQSAKGGTNGMPLGAGNALWIPTVDPSQPIDQWQDSTGDSASPSSNNEGGSPNQTQNQSNATPPAVTETKGSGNFLSDLASGFASGLSGGNSLVASAVNAVTGNQSGDNNPSSPQPTGNVQTSDQMSEEDIFKWFRAKGYSPEVTSGIMGRLKQENNFSPKYAKFQYVPGVGECGGFGMFQWTYGDGQGYNYPDPLGADKETVYQKFPNERLVKYMKWVDSNNKGNYESSGNELEYLYEVDMKDHAHYAKESRYVGNSEKSVPMNSWYPDDFNKLTMHQAAVKWTNDYEIGQEGKEQQYAQEIYDKYAKGGGGFGGLSSYMSSGIYGGGGKGINDAIDTNLQFAGPLAKRPRSELIIVHNTGSGTGRDEDHGAAALHEIGLSKDDKLGAAYHFNIRKNGDVEKLRPLDALGSHAGGTNSNSIGIHMAGDFYKDSDHTGPHRVPQSAVTNADMTAAQQDSLAQVVADVASTYSIPIDRQHVVGHWEPYEIQGISNEPGAYNPKDTTACPGNGVMDHLNDVVNKARQLKGLPATEGGGNNGQPVLNGDDIIATGWQTFQGMKYVMGGTGADNTIDCSGFTQATFKLAGLTIPRTADEQYKAFKAKDAIVDLDKAQPGDLVFFENTYGNFGSGVATHVGIYKGNGKFIHASSGAGKVTESDINSSYYQSHKLGAGSIQKMFGITPGSGKEGRKLDGKNIPPITGGAQPNANAPGGTNASAAGQSKFSIIGQALGSIIRGRMNSLLSGEDEIGKMLANGEFNFSGALTGTPAPSGDGTTPAPGASSDKPTSGEPSGSAEFKEEWTSLSKWDKLDAYATYMSDYAKAKYGTDVPTWWWRAIMRAESGAGESDIARNWHNFGGMDYDPIMKEVDPSAHGERFHDGTSWHNGAVFASDKHGLQAEVEWFLNPKKGYHNWWAAEIAAAQANDVEKAIGLHINHYVFGEEGGHTAAERPDYLDVAKEEFKRGANVRYGGGGGGLEYLLGYGEDIGGGGDFIYQNIPGYQGIPDNLIDGTETIPVQRAKYETQLQSMQNILPDTYYENGIQYDNLGNILGLTIPEYNLITPDDSIAVKRAKQEAQLAQLNGGGGKINYLAALFGDKEAQRAIGEAWSDALHPRKAKAKREAAEKKKKEAELKKAESVKRDFSKWKGGEYFNDVNAVHPMVHDYLKGNVSESDLKKVVGVTDNETYLTAEQQQMLGFREYAKNVRNWNHFVTSSKLWASDGVTPVEAWIKVHPEAQWKPEKKDEKKPAETAADIAKKPEELKIEGETFIAENDDSPTAKLARELKIRFDRFGNAVHQTKKYPDELKITEKDDDNSKYSKQAKQLAYIKELLDAERSDETDKPKPEEETKPEKTDASKPKRGKKTDKPKPQKVEEPEKPEGPKPDEETDAEPSKPDKPKRTEKPRQTDKTPPTVPSSPESSERQDALIMAIKSLDLHEQADSMVKYLEFLATGKNEPKKEKPKPEEEKSDKPNAPKPQEEKKPDKPEPEKEDEEQEDQTPTKNEANKPPKKKKKKTDKPKPEKAKPKPDTAEDIADKKEKELKIEGETFIDEKDDSPVAKLSRELGIRFDRFGNAAHADYQYPDELKITEKDDEATKYSKQAKQIAYIKELHDKDIEAQKEKEKPKPTEPELEEQETEQPEKPNKPKKQQKPKQERHHFDFYETNLGKLFQTFGIGPKRKKKKPDEDTAEDIVEEKQKEKDKTFKKGKKSTSPALNLEEIDSDVIVKRAGKPEDFGLDKLKADEMNPELIKEVANRLHLEFDDLGNVKGLTKVPEYNFITKDDSLSVRYAKQRTQIVNFVEYGGKLPEVVDEEATRKAWKKKNKEAGKANKPEEDKKSEKDKPKIDPNFGLGESVVDEKDDSPVAKMARELGLKFDKLGNIKDETINIPKDLVILSTDDDTTKYTKQAKQIANYKKWKKEAEKKTPTSPTLPESPEKPAGTNKPEIQAKTNPIESAASSSNVEYQSELISAIRSIDIRRQADMMVKYLEIIANGQTELTRAFSSRGQTPSGPTNPPTSGMIDLSAGQGRPSGNRLPAFSPNTGAKHKTDPAGKLDYAAVHSKNLQIAMGGDFANA